jgi:hypothetical protein
MIWCDNRHTSNNRFISIVSQLIDLPETGRFRAEIRRLAAAQLLRRQF